MRYAFAHGCEHAVAMQAQGLRPLGQKAAVMLDFIRYHDYEVAALDEDERERLVKDLGPDGRVLILRNHGALTVGRSIRKLERERGTSYRR